MVAFPFDLEKLIDLVCRNCLGVVLEGTKDVDKLVDCNNEGRILNVRCLIGYWILFEDELSQVKLLDAETESIDTYFLKYSLRKSSLNPY